MKLYKNVDICDLKSILDNGILSIDECGNNNWDSDRRANNDTSVVYLFSPIKDTNTFPNYGVALLEVDCDASVNQMHDNDIHKDDYLEYTIDRVSPDKIKRIIIPEIFKSYINIPEGINVTWCGIKADVYGHDGLKACSSDILNQFASTAQLEDTEECNFFRGVTSDRFMIDLYNVQYVF